MKFTLTLLSIVSLAVAIAIPDTAIAGRDTAATWQGNQKRSEEGWGDAAKWTTNPNGQKRSEAGQWQNDATEWNGQNKRGQWQNDAAEWNGQNKRGQWQNDAADWNGQNKRGQWQNDAADWNSQNKRGQWQNDAADWTTGPGSTNTKRGQWQNDATDATDGRVGN